MDVLSSALVALAVLSLGLAATASSPPGGHRLLERLVQRSARRLQAARIQANPRAFLAVSLLSPPVLAAIGWLQSPVFAVAAGAAGLVAPRLYLSWLIHMQSRRSEAGAGPLLQSVITGIGVGGTYLDGLREARAHCTDSWIAQDLDLVIQRFLLDAPLHETIREVRTRTSTRNLGLIWQTLQICTEHHLPTDRARTLLLELSNTVQFNVQLANEVRARAAGQQAQIWLLAVIVPGMYIYLRLMSPDLLSVLDSSLLGRYVLFPAAALLEVAGIALSFRIARVQP